MISGIEIAQDASQQFEPIYSFESLRDLGAPPAQAWSRVLACESAIFTMIAMG